MPNFKVINNNNNIMLNDQWVPSLKFNCRNRIVDEQGKATSVDYEGRQYQIIDKKERTFSTCERLGRGLLGVAAVVCTLTLALFSKSVRNLFTKSKENIRFAVLLPSKAEVTSNKKLEEAISISENTIAKIQGCMDSILRQHQKEHLFSGITEISGDFSDSDDSLEDFSDLDDSLEEIRNTCRKTKPESTAEEGIKFYNGQPTHRIFSLDTSPGLIFKMSPYGNESMKSRYQKMVFAETTIRTNKLGLLVIPHAKLFTVEVRGKKYEILAEQKLDINPNDSAQDKYFQDYADSLNETIRQLAVFICKTGYSDVEWRNNPVLNNSLDESGNRKIALIDTEEMSNAKIGLFGGGWGRRGLVGCVNETQGKLIETVAEQYRVDTSSFQAAHNKRKKELEEDLKLTQYYATRSIVIGNEPVLIEETLLTFPSHPEKTEKLKAVTLSLLKAINLKISNDSPENSIKGRRSILIRDDEQPFRKIGSSLINKTICANAYKTDAEYHNAKFLGHAINKLKDLGVIYNVIPHGDNHTYTIQA